MSDYLDRFRTQKNEDERAMTRPANSVNQSPLIPPTDDAIARALGKRERLEGPTSFRPEPEVQSYVENLGRRQPGVGQVTEAPKAERAGIDFVERNEALPKALQAMEGIVRNPRQGTADMFREFQPVGDGFSPAIANFIETGNWRRGNQPVEERVNPPSGASIVPVQDPLTGQTRYITGDNVEDYSANVNNAAAGMAAAQADNRNRLAQDDIQVIRGTQVTNVPRPGGRASYAADQIAGFDSYDGYDFSGLSQNERRTIADSIVAKEQAERELRAAQMSGIPMEGQAAPLGRVAIANADIAAYNEAINNMLDPRAREAATIERQLTAMEAAQKFGPEAASAVYNQQIPELGGMAAIEAAREGRKDEDYFKQKEEAALDKRNTRDSVLVQYAADMGIPRLSLGQQRELMEALGDGPVDKNEAQRLIAVQQLLSQGKRRGFFNDDDPRGSLAEVTPYQAKPWELLTPRRVFPWAGHAALGLKGPEGQPYYIRDPTEEQRDLMEFAFGKKAEWPLD
jgi:hypothetical protein